MEFEQIKVFLSTKMVILKIFGSFYCEYRFLIILKFQDSYMQKYLTKKWVKPEQTMQYKKLCFSSQEIAAFFVFQ